jgi:DNA-binding NarL/FixJ family response regulator
LRICEETEHPVQLLVTDVVMPGMGGKELATQVGGKFPDVRVLFMTGYTDDEVLRRGILDQGRAIILKPFSSDEFLRRIRKVLAAE